MNVAHEKLAAALLVLAITAVATPIFIPAASAQSSGNLQTDFLALVNAERARLGKNPLVANSQLESAAYLHSKDMGDNDFFDHTSRDGTTFSQRITNTGYRWVSCSENIAMTYGAPSSAKVYDMWKNSVGHYANMIGNYADAGLGVYSTGGYTYYTLDLSRGQSSPTQTPIPTVSATPASHPTATQTTTPTQPPTSTPTPTAKATPTATPTQTPNPTTTDPPPSTPKLPAQTTSISKPSAASNPEPTSTASVQPTPTSTVPENSLALLLVATLLIVIGVVVKHTLKQ